jgi:hypothetical protein
MIVLQNKEDCMTDFLMEEEHAIFEDFELESFIPAVISYNPFQDVKSFELFLAKRKFEPDKVYGLCERDTTMCRFFGSKNGESILADIEQKNEEQKMGNIAIPNTRIKLINYSVCPKCKTVFTFKELMDYYKNPKPDPLYKNKGLQLREDTRVHCYDCGEYFLPALVISDGTPKNEVQFLCRMQTVGAIEKYFLKQNVYILSKNQKNIYMENGFITIKNDVRLQNLESKPTLICNMLQYTPISLMPNLIDGSNIEKGDILFGKMRPLYY